MMSMRIFEKCIKAKKMHPPEWMRTNTAYQVIMGSQAYNAHNDYSDVDVHGVVLPPKALTFPASQGLLFGFDKYKIFEYWEQHHVNMGEVEYDFAMFGIIRFFELAIENNPNILEMLYVPSNCVLHTTDVGNMMRDNRDMFLHQRILVKLKGYAYGQLTKLDREPDGKRAAIVEKYGFDVKFASHVVRLMLQAEQVLKTGTMRIAENGELLKAIKRGEWSKRRIQDFFDAKSNAMEKLVNETTLPAQPDRDAIRGLLINCLEHHYGSIGDLVNTARSDSEIAVRDVLKVLKAHGYTS